MKKKVLAIILAGGNGTRMGTLTSKRSKPVLPFGAGCKVIDFTLTNCLRSGIRDIYALVDYQKQSTSEYLSNWSLTNTMENELKILKPENGHYLGTADAVRQNLSHIKKAKPDVVMILAADHIYKMDFRDMLNFHTDKKADVTLAVQDVKGEDACRFGIVSINKRHEVERFAEKPRLPESTLASMGIYAINTDSLVAILQKGFISTDIALDFGHDIIPAMLGQRSVLAFEHAGYWRDIGTVEAYYQANMDLLGKEPLIRSNWWSQVLTDSKDLFPVKIAHSNNIINSIIYPPCLVEGRVENSILARDVYVKRHAIVRNSIIMSNTEIGEHSIVDHTILDQDVKVDRSCYVGNPGGYDNKSNITVIKKGSHVPSNDVLLPTNKNSFEMNQDAVTRFGNKAERIFAR